MTLLHFICDLINVLVGTQLSYLTQLLTKGTEEMAAQWKSGLRDCKYSPVLLGSRAGRVAVPSGYAGFTNGSCLTWPRGMVDDWMYGPTAATLDGPVCWPACPSGGSCIVKGIQILKNSQKKIYRRKADVFPEERRIYRRATDGEGWKTRLMMRLCRHESVFFLQFTQILAGTSSGVTHKIFNVSFVRPTSSHSHW